MTEVSPDLFAQGVSHAERTGFIDHKTWRGLRAVCKAARKYVDGTILSVQIPSRADPQQVLDFFARATDLRRFRFIPQPRNHIFDKRHNEANVDLLVTPQLHGVTHLSFESVTLPRPPVEIEDYTSLQHLVFIGMDTDFAQLLPKLPLSITRLVISHCAIKAEDIAPLTRFTHLTGLSLVKDETLSFDIEDSKMSWKALEELPENLPPALRSLYLSSFFEEKDQKYIAEQLEGRELRLLTPFKRVDNNRITPVDTVASDRRTLGHRLGVYRHIPSLTIWPRNLLLDEENPLM